MTDPVMSLASVMKRNTVRENCATTNLGIFCNFENITIIKLSIQMLGIKRQNMHKFRYI